MESDKEDWDVKLPAVVFAINSSSQSSSGFSPFKLMYGSEARLPQELPGEDCHTKDRIDSPEKHYSWKTFRR